MGIELGLITIDGISTRAVALRQLRSSMALIPQVMEMLHSTQGAEMLHSTQGAASRCRALHADALPSFSCYAAAT
jgi:hypothetical protein